jgi:hypothetical protein
MIGATRTAVTPKYKISPAAIPMTVFPAPAFVVTPVEVDTMPTVPSVPAAAIPEVGLIVPPTIIVRTAYILAIEINLTVVNVVTTIAIVVVGIGVTRARRIIPGPIVISGHAHADMKARPTDTNMDAHLRIGRCRGQQCRACHYGSSRGHLQK